MKAPLFAVLLSLSLAAEDFPSVDAMSSAAEVFLGSLDENQRRKATFPLTSDAREHFRFTPQTRSGLAFGEMSETQRVGAMRLLEAALSDKGRLKATQIMTLESVLAELENRPQHRDPGKYFLSVFGKPGDAKGWGWKFEGHHLSLNYAFAGDAKFSVTPSFFGANPAEVREGGKKGLRVLRAEDELAHTLLRSLLDGGKKDVVFSAKAPAEILTAENRKAPVPVAVGVLARDMSEGQKTALRELISEYTGRHREDLARADMKKIEEAGFDAIRFGWAGGTAPGEAWYYRIQGPTFVMEAANTQNQANHIHTTWRNFEGDFGRDILAEHYRQHADDHGDH